MRGGAKLPWSSSIEILMTVFAQGHRVDPVQALEYRCVLSLARLARLDDMSCEDFNAVWEACRQAGGPVGAQGPVSRLWRSFVSLHWHWNSPFEITLPSETTYSFPIQTAVKGAFAHELREALRQREVRL